MENNKPDINNSVFAESVKNMTSADITPSGKTKKRRSKAEKVITDIAFIVCIAVFLGCLYKIGENLIGKYIGESFYESIAEDFFDFDATTSDTESSFALNIATPSKKLPDYETALAIRGSTEGSHTTDVTSSQLAAVRAKLNAYRLKNDEIFGVIRVTGTNIAYTLVRHDDNDYYLTHSTEKKPLVIGSIFLDYRNSTVLHDNKNSVLYGHNMTSGSMFHELERYEDDAELFSSSLIYVYTLDGIYVYKPFSFYRTDKRSDYIKTSFSSPAEFTEWVTEIKNRSLHETDTEISESMEILTLSTCINYSYNNDGRFALHAVLVDVITD